MIDATNVNSIWVAVGALGSAVVPILLWIAGTQISNNKASEERTRRLHERISSEIKELRSDAVLRVVCDANCRATSQALEEHVAMIADVSRRVDDYHGGHSSVGRSNGNGH